MRSREFLRIETGIWPRQAGRVVRFPDGRSIGSVCTLSMTEFREGLECWRLLGEARGTLHLLRLPADAVLRLDLNLVARSDPSPLGQLAPGDLQWLSFRAWGPSIQTDDALRYVRHMTGLEGLDLGGTALTDAGLGHLGGLSGLRYLLIEGNPVTDAGLLHLAALAKLEHLDLWGEQVKITDAGLVHLKGMTALRYLGLAGTKVTESGWENLRRGLPNLQSRG